MNNRFPNTLIIAAASILLFTSYASAAKVRVSVDNDYPNETLRLRARTHIPAFDEPFPATNGIHEITVPNGTYSMLFVRIDNNLTAMCTKDDQPNSPFINHIDLDGDDKSFDVIFKHKDGETPVCYKAGG